MEGWGAGRADETVKEEEVRDRRGVGMGKGRSHRAVSVCCLMPGETIDRMRVPAK